MKKIMIVEDDKTIANELKLLLNSSDYEAIILEDFLNAKDEILNNTPDLILLDISADDYVTKPYNPTILLLKISALFKRCDMNKNIITYKDLTFDIGKGIVKNNNGEVILTKNEIIIFNLLLTNKERIVTKDELMTDLWNNDEYVNENALTVNISRLRSKLMELGYDNIIETRKGIGYRIL